MELVRNRRRRFADAAGFVATLALILWHRGNKKPRRIRQMPKTGTSCSRPFSDLFNVAASRSAQMTTRKDLRLGPAKSSNIAFRLSKKGECAINVNRMRDGAHQSCRHLRRP